MELSKNELKELHNIEMDMAIEVLSIFDKLNLRYCFIGGSALGAIRHNGFIPWDDDIDIGMPRKDYNIFLEKAPLLLSEKLFLQTQLTDEGYDNFFTKIRRNETTFIEEVNVGKNFHQGVFIDIFPLDGAGDSIEEAEENLRKFAIIQEKLKYMNKSYKIKDIRSLLRHFYYSINILKDKIQKKYKSKNDLYNFLNKFCETEEFDRSKYSCNYSGAWGKKEIIPREWFGEFKKIKFENIYVNVPENYDKYLNKLYGDYMKLLPVHERIAPHCYLCDFEKSYCEYIEK